MVVKVETKNVEMSRNIDTGNRYSYSTKIKQVKTFNRERERKKKS